MANIIGIEVSGDTYDLEDSQARQDIQTNAQDIDGIEGKIPSSASTSNKLATENDIPTVVDVVEQNNSSAVSSKGVYEAMQRKSIVSGDLNNYTAEGKYRGNGQVALNLPDQNITHQWNLDVKQTGDGCFQIVTAGVTLDIGAVRMWVRQCYNWGSPTWTSWQKII